MGAGASPQIGRRPWLSLAVPKAIAFPSWPAFRLFGFNQVIELARIDGTSDGRRPVSPRFGGEPKAGVLINARARAKAVFLLAAFIAFTLFNRF